MTYGDWAKPESLDYMHKAVALVRGKYPQMPLLFSCSETNAQNYLAHDLCDFDLFDPHIWWSSRTMASSTNSPTTTTNASMPRDTRISA